jgi:hypothetical protein
MVVAKKHCDAHTVCAVFRETAQHVIQQLFMVPAIRNAILQAKSRFPVITTTPDSSTTNTAAAVTDSSDTAVDMTDAIITDAFASASDPPSIPVLSTEDKEKIKVYTIV